MTPNVRTLPLERALRSSEHAARYFLHKHDMPLAVSRLLKFALHPIAFTYHLAIKVGLPLRGEPLVRTFWDGRMRVPLRDEDGALLYYTGSLGLKEYPVIRFLIRELRPGMVFYDIGANLGFFSALASALGSDVHAFEPGQNVLRFTRQNVRGTLTETAVSDLEGVLTFYENDIVKSGMSTAVHAAAQENKYPYTERTVQSTTLDAYAAAHPSPHMIKIDVEGFEERVITGASKMLGAHSPTILMEIATRHAVKAASARAIATLSAHGYRSFAFTDAGNLQPATIDLDAIRLSENYCFRKVAT